MRNKKLLIILIVVLLCLCVGGFFLFNRMSNINKSIKKVEFIDNLDIDFLADIKISSLIKRMDGKIIDDKKIDTTTLGKKEIKFTFVNDDNIKINHKVTINVVDRVAPLIWLNKTYNVTKGSENKLTDKILCGDNYDSKPKCEIKGEYNLDVVGSYNLEFVATDSSGNTTRKDFVLKVNEPVEKKPSNSNTPKVTTAFSDIVAAHKTEKTQIGIDISKWQSDVDFNKLKAAGVEFVMIRVGSASGIDGDYFVDSKFVQNIENANKAGIPVGIYYYSYAHTKSRAIKDAKWVIEQIKNYKVDLPVAFDWERWNSFNEYHVSFYELSSIATAFLDTLKDAGYEGLLYSSKTYLENIWMPINYPTWLAHYTKNAKESSYKGEYNLWQVCSNGRVDGINGDVDIDVRYLK